LRIAATAEGAEGAAVAEGAEGAEGTVFGATVANADKAEVPKDKPKKKKPVEDLSFLDVGVKAITKKK